MPHDSLTPEQAEVLLRADSANIARLATQGKPLPADFRRLLRAIASSRQEGRSDASDLTPEPEFARTQDELAKFLDCSRKSIVRAMREDGRPQTEADGRYNVQAWRLWFKSRGKRICVEEGDDSLKDQLLKRQIAKIDHWLAERRRLFIPTDLARQMAAGISAKAREVVDRIHLAAPDLAGMSAAEIDGRLREVEREIIAALHEMPVAIEEWQAGADVEEDGAMPDEIE